MIFGDSSPAVRIVQLKGNLSPLSVQGRMEEVLTIMLAVQRCVAEVEAAATAVTTLVVIAQGEDLPHRC